MSIRRERRARVLWATIERPDALNAISTDVMAGLEETLELAEAARGEIRALVLSGQGAAAFASGGDLKEFAGLVEPVLVEAMALRMQAILKRFEALDAWTIACINGGAYGGGCETALAFDFRIACEGARLGFTQGRFNLPPGWGGLTRLVEIVGRPRAVAWLAQASVVSATEALEAGLLHRVVPSPELREVTWAWAERLSEQDVELIAALKQGARRAVSLPREQALAAELAPFVDLWVGETHHERVRSFLERKAEEGEEAEEAEEA